MNRKFLKFWALFLKVLEYYISIMNYATLKHEKQSGYTGQMV